VWIYVFPLCVPPASSSTNKFPYIWACVINALLPGWVTGPDANQIPRVLGLASIWLLVVILFFGTGLIFEVPIWLLEIIVYISRPKNKNLVMTISPHASESPNLIFFNL
jgi:hypothetical protein